jgi:hypothetical protein
MKYLQTLENKTGILLELKTCKENRKGSKYIISGFHIALTLERTVIPHEVYVAGAVDERRTGGLNVELYQGSLLEKDAWKSTDMEGWH